MPPIAPAMPPMPTTELTVAGGIVSDTSVYRFADQPWCADAARPISTTAVHWSATIPAANTGTTHNAHASIAVLRPAFTDQPRRISHDDSQPPPTLPTSVIR